ncbi:MAG: hypothetical protein CMK03_14105 [Ponticaulis sp.]|nr:hypothetical protein [Ponticaulis sp.]|tara:strand:- start:84 stop:659 length:576 start_codon:yes stop_codon:yes gene_type:complete
MRLKSVLPAGLAALSACAIAFASMPAAGQADMAQQQPAIADDGREILFLTPEQRTHVREEMRMFITGVQALTAALAEEDRAAIAQAASSMGRPGRMNGQMGQGHGHGQGNGMGRGMGHGGGQGMHQGQGMGGMMASMPAPFHTLGRGTRISFEEIAAMSDTAEMQDIQRAFADTLQNCVTCHSSYTARDAQ